MEGGRRKGLALEGRSETPPRLALGVEEMDNIIAAYELEKRGELKEDGLPRVHDRRHGEVEGSFSFSKARVMDNLPERAQERQKIARLKELGGKKKHLLMAA